MGIYKRKGKRGISWRIDYKYQGRRRYETVHGTKEMARRALAQRIHEIESGKFGLALERTPGFTDFAQEFLAYCRARCRAGTVLRYSRSIERLKRSFGNVPVGEITPVEIQRFVEARSGEVTARTVNRDLACLRRMFTVAEERGFVRDVARLFKGAKVKEAETPARYLTEEEQAQLLAACRTENEKLFVYLGLYAGLRFGEIVGLRWRDVDFGANTLTVSGESAKTRKTRTISLAPPLRKVLLDSVRRGEYVICSRNGKGYTNARNLWRALAKRGGLEDVTPHALRHTFATNLLRAGVDPRTVQDFGGWSDIRLLQRYGHVSAQAKQEAMAKLGAVHERLEAMAEAQKLIFDEKPGKRDTNLIQAENG